MEILASCVGKIPVSRSTTALRQKLPFGVSRSNFRFTPKADLTRKLGHVRNVPNTGLGLCDHLIDLAPYANTPRTKPSDFAHDALGVNDDAALQELSGQRRSRDKDWPPRD